MLDGALALDAAGTVVLSTNSLLFLACAVYAQGYLRRRSDRDNRVFVGGLLVLLSALTAVSLAQHLGALWVAVELTTLATAPLIYFNRNARSLEAAWKYLLLCSLGIALALLGTFFLALAGTGPGGPRSLMLGDLLRAGRALEAPWVRGAFVFLLVGYGTKMGLAPFHTWKPDAYGEAPGLLGALLAGPVGASAFLILARVQQVMRAAGEDRFAGAALVSLGLLSMAVAAVYVASQRDLKRMLAWSSVEHAGVLALGLGLGGAAVAAAWLHVAASGLTKGVLFLSAGNIHRAFGSKLTDDVRGAARRLPISGPLFLLAFLAASGSPPFAPFLSEFGILGAAVSQGRPAVAALYLAFLAIIFLGMGRTVMRVVLGDPAGAPERPFPDSVLSAAPPLTLMGLVVALGLWVPGGLADLLRAAAALVTG
jgi:hydrogenase-4 component F